MGVPNCGAMGCIIGVLNIVPIFGPILASIIALVGGLFNSVIIGVLGLVVNGVGSFNYTVPSGAVIGSSLVVVGSFNETRVYNGDIGLGVGKLLTCGGCGIWAIIDWFMIRDAVKNANYSKFLMMLSLNGC